MLGLFNMLIVQIYLAIQFITRVSLSGYGLYNDQISIAELPIIFFVGLTNDIISLCYFLPALLLIAILSHKILASSCQKLYRYLSIAAYFCIVTIFILNSISEVIFWDEFGIRFNFIAVDYLVYTHEIIGTLRESLPLPLIVCSIMLIAFTVTFFAKKSIFRNISSFSYARNMVYATFTLCTSCLLFYSFDSKKLDVSNRYAAELSKNGLYELFSAFRNNSLDYNQFYSVIDNKLALDIVRSKILQQNQQSLNDKNIERINNALQSSSGTSNKKYNVILIVVESLSARFLSQFGNQDGITPYLDQLAKESILFTKLYATGTRTVRGVEAITLSTVATPGSSIIRRSENQHLFNISTIFREHDYNVNFIFGGYSYFDNLQNYFGGNGYKITDRGDFKASEISFSNIWGIADEDIFTKAITMADYNTSNSQLFFSLILTTSNHRPYSFPESRIDLPSGSGRNAAVKYTDYAIGKFIEEAKKHSWFDDTIFVITADHCAVGTGKIDLPIDKYHIPLIIYAPKIIQPKIIDSIVSQIDIAPTIINLALAEISYKTKFFGQDILHNLPNRAFVSTYQLLGYISGENLVILAPNQQATTYKLIGGEQHKIDNIPSLVNEAISFYQTAYRLYVSGEMKE